ncbi:mechanosensitive ion channel family protein [Brucepastera parasyntrophica]|uniref:mechanosensitive ion channel family protein n=1 Tax=Brucepastera parasyntrophica TaxID=2880008 RepID=UPI00210EB3FC|nr:mechanosensitive ion channel family protein [Brucepastera parasyntrophica]ULQ58571.1 mechanosensitive ion channel family protein [Brucepastera parasyntrophica]
MEAVLEYVFLGNSVKQWIIAVSCIIGGLVLGKILAAIFRGLHKKISAKIRIYLDEKFLASYQKAITILMLLLGTWTGLRFLHIDDKIKIWVDRGLSVIVICAVCWTVFKILDSIIAERIYTRKNASGNLEDIQFLQVLRRLTNSLAWIIALVLVLKTLGYNIGAILAGLGLGGVAVALAAKDTLSNLFGSVTVFVDKPFKVNDRIKFSGFDGTITEMNLRTSRLRTQDNHIVTIPNGMFASAPIENVSLEPNTKVFQSVNISKAGGYEKLTAAMEILRAVSNGLDEFDTPSEVLLTSVNGAAYTLQFAVFIKKDAGYSAALNAVNLKLIQQFREAGIDLV